MTSKLDAAREHVESHKPELLALIRDIGADGHGLYGPDVFTEHAMDPLYRGFARRHKSGRDPKAIIFVDGIPVRALEGVYWLEITRWLVDHFGLHVRHFRGRGTQCGADVAALIAHLTGETGADNDK